MFGAGSRPLSAMGSHQSNSTKSMGYRNPADADRGPFSISIHNEIVFDSYLATLASLNEKLFMPNPQPSSPTLRFIHLRTFSDTVGMSQMCQLLTHKPGFQPSAAAQFTAIEISSGRIGRMRKPFMAGDRTDGLMNQYHSG